MARFGLCVENPDEILQPRIRKSRKAAADNPNTLSCIAHLEHTTLEQWSGYIDTLKRRLLDGMPSVLFAD
jgi:hypothetical protein